MKPIAGLIQRKTALSCKPQYIPINSIYFTWC